MEDRTNTRKTGQARGKLMRLEQDLRRTKGNLTGATRNRIVGGVMLLIGVLALIGSLTGDSGFLAFVAAVALLGGAIVFIRAQIRTGDARRSIDTMTDDVTGARANLTELEAQSPPKE
ncbi:MAG: Rab5-interacting family protein [Anaerolineae bacterium]|nr:Rab5-interacting family protein [Anaerolineae bacterium]